MNLKSKSKEGQDIFAHRLLGDRGFFLDVGCGDHPIKSNNTYALEKSGWTGLLFDMDKALDSFTDRRAPHFRVDVTTPEFLNILNRKSPKDVDYISLDVDESSVNALEMILDYGIKFKVMTFEHDQHKHGDLRREPSRKLLHEAGYKILFGNVRSRVRETTRFGTRWHKHGMRNESGEKVLTRVTDKWCVSNWGTFEDWWVDPNSFSDNLLSIGDEDIYWKDCINLIEKNTNFPEGNSVGNVDDILCLK